MTKRLPNVPLLICIVAVGCGRHEAATVPPVLDTVTESTPGSAPPESTMSDEATFLRAVMVSPSDASHRQAYVDWLKDRDAARAKFLQIDTNFDRISYVDWLERDGSLDFYVKGSPEVKQLAEQRRATDSVRREMHELSARLDPEWVSFVNTLGQPFREFFFFNNGGNSRECQPDELPFREPIGTRGGVITFESAFTNNSDWDSGLLLDLRFLSQLKLENCYYGAATCPVHLFMCEISAERVPLTGADILAAVKPREFRSEHIEDLNATAIPYPGYNPGTDNDEVHNDFKSQYIFAHGDDEDDDMEEEMDEFTGTHGELKRFVDGGQLWYVLLHTTPEKVEEFQFSRYAILLAVGRSPNGRRLIGVITHQVCHNLCD